VTIGELPAARVRELTGGLLGKSIPLTVNRLLARDVYDTILIFGGTVPTRWQVLPGALNTSFRA